MKKLLTLCLLMAVAFAVNTQSKEETLKWLNTRKSWDKSYFF
ncbi:MAG TPA: hypothetical protein VFR70_07235 [Flavobacterium sp.]|nr:hypothetical protein [Flavobacterium sp.]